MFSGRQFLKILSWELRLVSIQPVTVAFLTLTDNICPALVVEADPYQDMFLLGTEGE